MSRCERPETFAVFDLEVELLLHGRGARIAEDRTRAERARAELHAALEPSDRLLRGEGIGCFLDHLRLGHRGEARAGRREPLLGLGL